jgi:hypothetical protein
MPRRRQTSVPPPVPVPSLASRWAASAKQSVATNPITSAIVVMTFFIGLSSLVAGRENLAWLVDHYTPASPSYARKNETTDKIQSDLAAASLKWQTDLKAANDKLAAELAAANTKLGVEIYGLKLSSNYTRERELKRGLEEAQAELAANPSSRTARDAVDSITKSLATVQKFLDDASKHGAE